MPPMQILHEDEIDPLRIIRKQRGAIEIVVEYLFEVSTCRFLVHVLKAGSLPGLFVAFDDEGAERIIEFIRVRSEYSGGVLVKGQREPVEQVRCSVPDVAIG